MHAFSPSELLFVVSRYVRYQMDVSCILFVLLVSFITYSSQSPGIPKFGEPISNLTVPMGRDATFACVVEDLATYKVAWLRVDTQTILTIHSHVITKNHRISVTHTDEINWYLKIKDVRETDRGFYMCQINTDPMKSQIGYLDVVVSPDILDYSTSPDQIIREGSNVTLRCSASGSPPPNITWRKEAGELIVLNNDQGVSSVEGPLLNITKVNRLHMGAYLCIASNGVPPSVSKRISLIVHFAPMVWIQNQLVGAHLEQQITMECHSEAFPKSINIWKREGGDDITQGTKYVTDIVNNAYKTLMKLTIRSVSVDDYGAYKCISRNSLGETDGTIKLYQIATPTTTPRTTVTIPTTTAYVSTTSVPQMKKPSKSRNEANNVNSIPIKSDKDRIRAESDEKKKPPKSSLNGFSIVSTIIHSASKSYSARTTTNMNLLTFLLPTLITSLVFWFV